MPRFAILIHDHPHLHWDFLLEKEATLRTWRLTQEPGGAGDIVAEPLPDHRLLYLDYEGPVSGNRGTVRSFDRGDYTLREETTTAVRLDLQGTRLRGQAELRQSGASGAWVFRYLPDPSD